MTKPHFILASASPRRKDLLAQAGIVVDEVMPADIDETVRKGEASTAYVLRLAQEKAAHISNGVTPSNDGVSLSRMEMSPPCDGAGSTARHNSVPVVLAADTTVSAGRRILGKPESDEEAVAMLKFLSGRRHQVHTAFAIQQGARVVSKRVTSRVQFRPLSEVEIYRYVASGQASDKCGAYGIHTSAASFVKQINGSYTNIVGLPMAEAIALLRSFGLTTE